MKCWLMKSEPDVFSIDDLHKAEQQITSWEGVRNYQARNYMRDEMRVGDLAFFYHSNCSPPGIVGIMEVVKNAYPDASAWNKASQYYDAKSSPANPRWYMVDLRFKTRFVRLVTLDELKHAPGLEQMPLLRRGNRLSITPVSKSEWDIIVNLV